MPLSTSDKLYLTFFCLFIPAIALVDLVPFYPPSLVPAPVMALHEFYLDTFNDQLMIKSPPWFVTFALIEACYNFPAAIWLVFAILRRVFHPIPSHLIPSLKKINNKIVK